MVISYLLVLFCAGMADSESDSDAQDVLLSVRGVFSQSNWSINASEMTGDHARKFYTYLHQNRSRKLSGASDAVQLLHFSMESNTATDLQRSIASFFHGIERCNERAALNCRQHQICFHYWYLRFCP